VNRLLCAILFALLCGPALAQTQAQAQAKPDEPAMQAERADIATQRAKAETDYAAERRACYQKFAVNGCLRDASARHRQILAELRRREIALDDAERRQQAGERQAELQQKAADAGRKRSEAEPAGAPSGTPRRSDAAADRSGDAAAARGAAEDRQRRHQQELDAQAQKAKAAAAERARYDAKIKDAEERKADRDRRQREDAAPPAKPLPIPP
jgi:hypothetical protein